MKIFVASLESVSKYSQSRAHTTPKLDKETADDHEKRTWRERCHYLSDGRIFIPPTSFKECIANVAGHLGMKIPGRGSKTYKKSFVSGVMCVDGPVLPITKDEVEGEWLFLNADGVKGSGKRVWRCMPSIKEWKADVTFHILDELVTMDIFKYHLEQAGAFVGIGRFRPERGGFYGRFKVNKIAEQSL